MQGLISLIKKVLNTPIIPDDGPELSNAHARPLPEKVKKSLDKILENLKVEKAPEKINAYVEAYKIILKHYINLGRGILEIDGYLSAIRRYEQNKPPKTNGPHYSEAA